MSRVRWSNDAVTDLERIAVYIDRYDGAAARRVVAAIIQATVRLGDFLLSGSQTTNRGIHKVSVPRWHCLVYDRPGEEVTILRVVHARRQR